MIHIEILHEKISMSICDELENPEEEILNELGRVLSYVIAVYKLRIERKRRKHLEPIEENWINVRIKETITFFPIDKVRDAIIEESIE